MTLTYLTALPFSLGYKEQKTLNFLWISPYDSFRSVFSFQMTLATTSRVLPSPFQKIFEVDEKHNVEQFYK